MVRTIIESPYAARGPFSVANHERYARLCMADSLRRGEAPFLSHLLYTQCLADTVPDQRKKGIEAGFTWAAVADLAAVYYDLGITPGMKAGIDFHRQHSTRVVLRRLFSPTVGRALRAGYLTLAEAESEQVIPC